MKAKGFWLVVALACMTGLFLTARSDWRLVTGDVVFARTTIAGVAPDPKGRAGRWYAVYNVPGDDGQLVQVRDSKVGSGTPPALDYAVKIIYPKGHPERAQPIALGKRAFVYLLLLGFLVISLIALFSRRTDQPEVTH